MSRTIVAGLAVLLSAGTVHAADTHVMVCSLRGTQEVPANPSPARGCGRFIIDTNANTIRFHIAYGNLMAGETAAHFHVGAPGVSGPVTIPLPPGNPKIGVVNYLEVDQNNILNGQWYVNIHTAALPGGEIRGQINTFACDLDSVQETPPNATTSRGWATMNYNLCTNQLRYYIVIESLSAAESAAHIHGLANYTVPAGIIVGLPAGTPKIGAALIAESQEQALLNGMMYVNIHTVAFPGGEIRGQIVSSVNPMDSTQEVPALAVPTAFGCTMCAFDRPANTLGYFVFSGGLVTAETAAHIHGFAPPGVNAAVVNPLALGSPKIGTWLYGAANSANVLADLTYTNVHTVANPGGQIRGQLWSLPKRCGGDTNCDGTSNIDDLVTVITTWGPCNPVPALCEGDLNYTGGVDIDDLVLVITSWGKCP